MITENLSTLQIHKLTQAQYDRELANGDIDENAMYLVPDEGIDLSGYVTEDQLNGKANAEHTHGIEDVDGLQVALDGKAVAGHTHDDRYYTESEIDTKIADSKAYVDSEVAKKADSGHTHTAAEIGADAVGSADTALADAKAYSNQNLATAKFYSDTNLATAKSYTDTEVAKKADSGHVHAIADIPNLQSTLDGKQAAITGAATTIVSSDLTANMALIANGSGKVAVSTATATELGYLSGVTSNIQGQLADKADASALDNYYTKTQIDALELITVDDIDAICGSSVQSASEVMF